jgi:hypothetical protein
MLLMLGLAEVADSSFVALFVIGLLASIVGTAVADTAILALLISTCSSRLPSLRFPS